MELNDIIDKAKALSKLKKIETPAGTVNFYDILPDLGISEILSDLDITKLLPSSSMITVIFLITGIIKLNLADAAQIIFWDFFMGGF